MPMAGAPGEPLANVLDAPRRALAVLRATDGPAWQHNATSLAVRHRVLNVSIAGEQGYSECEAKYSEWRMAPEACACKEVSWTSPVGRLSVSAAGQGHDRPAAPRLDDVRAADGSPADPTARTWSAADQPGRLLADKPTRTARSDPGYAAGGSRRRSQRSSTSRRPVPRRAPPAGNH
jgi:hypothetical protein